MKNIITPTENEMILDDDTQIISKTNAKGMIAYCNSTFINVSGYTEPELLGQPHNIIRHPDMPKAIFNLMWQTLQSKQEFNGYIKNLCKDGSCYWVIANVTPSMSADNELIGYYSVCRKTNIEKLNYIKNLYFELSELEAESESEDAITNSTSKLHSVLNAREVGYNEFILTL